MTTVAPSEFRSAKDALAAGLCPCGKNSKAAACCQPVIRGKRKAETPEELMRARYTAFAGGDVDFILSSHHSKTRDQVKREEFEEWSKKSEWLGLKVIETKDGGAKDSGGVVIFHAKYKTDDKEQDHMEYSHFEREDGDWKFLDAQGLHNGPIKREGPKLGRNDPCHCGSGKKLKKCHG